MKRGKLSRRKKHNNKRHRPQNNKQADKLGSTLNFPIDDKNLHELIDIIRAGIVTKTIASELLGETVSEELIQDLIAWCDGMEKEDE